MVLDGLRYSVLRSMIASNQWGQRLLSGGVEMNLSQFVRDCSQLTCQSFTQIINIEYTSVQVTFALVTTSMAFSGASWSILSLTC